MKSRLFLLGLLLWLLMPSTAWSQASVYMCVELTSGIDRCQHVSAANPLPVTGTFSATLGGFQPSAAGARGTPLSVTVADSTGTLPTGTVVAVDNTDTTNPIYCNVNGIVATISDKKIPANSWFSFTIPAAITTLHCIATGGTVIANMTGGTGLATGAGGGGGSGGGGAVTLAATAVSSGAYVAGSIGSGAIASGAIASGAVASGAVASGAFASGALSSGSIAAGAQVDLLTMRGTKAPGTAAANSMLNGGIYTAAGISLTDGQQAALQFDSTGHLQVVGTGVAQGSTTSGQTLSPVGGATTTSPPTYTTAQTNLLSLTTAGALRSDHASVNGTTALAGTGATGAGSPRVTQAIDQATNAGAALVKGGVGVVNGGSTYQAVAASATATVLQTSTGAIGDYLSHCVIYPTSTSPGVVTVFDNTNAAAGSAILFPGGASSLSNLAPIPVPVGAVSTAGAWKVTTGTAVSVVCYGKFSFRWNSLRSLG